MKITIFANGKEFTSKPTDEISAEKAKTDIYENLEHLGKIEIETEDGFVLLGKKALQNAVILITDT